MHESVYQLKIFSKYYKGRIESWVDMHNQKSLNLKKEGADIYQDILM